MNQTNSTAQTPPPDIGEMQKIMASIQPRNEWVLMAPDGRVWISSDVGVLFCALAPHHPLLKVAV